MKKKALILTALITLTASILALLRKVEVSKLECLSQYGKCSDILSQKLSAVKNGDIIFAKRKINAILAKDFQVKSFSIRYQFPTSFTISLIERKPKYALKKKDEDKIFIADSEGIILFLEDTSTFPVLEFDKEDLRIGDKLDKELLFCLEMLYSIENTFGVSSAEVRSSDFMIELKDGSFLAFPKEGDAKLLLGSATLIISKLRMAPDEFKMDKHPKVVDLRFKNPILRDSL